MRLLLVMAISFLQASCGVPPLPKPPIAVTPETLPPEIRAKIDRELAEERAAALKALASSPGEERQFFVGWDTHYGVTLHPKDQPPEIPSTPPYFDSAIEKQISDALGPSFRRAGDEPFAHLGQRLICDCIGIEWKTQRYTQFYIRSAKLHWEKPIASQR